MKNNILVMLIIATVASCTTNEAQLRQAINYNNGQLTIDIKSSKKHHLICKYLDEVFIDTLFKKTIDINLEDTLSYKSDLLRGIFKWKNIDKEYEKAYSLITNGYVPICVNLDDKIDTMFVKQIDLSPDNNLYAKVVSGKMCPIERYYLSIKGQNKIKNWLSNEEIVTSKDMGLMLTRMFPFDYTTKDWWQENIPVLKSFAGQKYKIESNLKADNYYLYAPEDISDLNKFIQEMIDNNYPSSVKNLNSTLSCFRKKGAGGRFVVFLVGINNDGSYHYIPIGLVAIDNVKPVINKTGGSFSSSCKYIHSCGLTVFGASNIGIEESVTISNGQFRGNDALFEIEFDAGIESISIKREIYHDYMKYSYKPETKTIRLSDKESPYRFRYVLDLFIGDNYIPITVTDKFGNSTNYTHKITMEEVNDND